MKGKTGLKICALFISATLALTAGVAVAYYNTRTFGFDSEAVVFSKDDEKIRFLDFELYYEDIREACDNISSLIPKNIIPISL